MPSQYGASAGPARVRPLSITAQRAVLLGTALLAALACVLAIMLVSANPWLGLRLQADGAAVRVASVVVGGPAQQAGVTPGMTVLELRIPRPASASVQHTLAAEAGDLIEDPDALNSYAAWAQFYQRQGVLSQLLVSNKLELRLRGAHGEDEGWVALPSQPERPVRTLPLAFWYQLMVGVFCLFVAGWLVSVYALRPATWSAVVGGLGAMLFCASAAVMSGREWALPPGLFHTLSVAQHSGAVAGLLGGAGIVSFFPRHLDEGRAAVYVAVVAFFMLWLVAVALWWMPSPDWGHRAMLLALACVVLVQALRQRRAADKHSGQRSLMLAMALPVVLGGAAFAVLQEGLALLRIKPPLPQSWMLGMMLISFIGVPLTVRRLSQFDLDEWVTHVLLAWASGVGVLAVYQILLAYRWMGENEAMAAAVVGCSVVYVPLYAWLWERFSHRRESATQLMTSEILALGLAQPADRLEHWRRLFGQLFHMRHMHALDAADRSADDGRVSIVAGGKGLRVPAVAGMPPVLLWRRNGGQRAFSRVDRRLTQRLLELVASIAHAQDAYGRGAAEERQRIADDLHDDLGATLLTLVHASEAVGAPAKVSVLARDALQEMRLSVRNMKAQPALATELLADWRAETVNRLAAAGIGVSWHSSAPPEPMVLNTRLTMQLTRVLREVISNIIRHSGGARCRVHVALTRSELVMEVEDNGRGFDPQQAAAGSGQGLINIERRVRRLGGSHRFVRVAGSGMRLSVRVPTDIAPAGQPPHPAPMR